MRSRIFENIDRHSLAIDSVRQNNIEDIVTLCEVAKNRLENGGKLLFAGNGGSAADSQHLAAEFVGRFKENRCALPALSLTTDTSILTAVGNDFGYDSVFERQVSALCNEQDVLVLISTSGNSQNLVNAALEGRRKKAFIVGLLGNDGGKLKSIVDLPIVVASGDTARIQECHILIGHILCDTCDENINTANTKI
jgi:D-sedoheptulose 7-phosphate isomerase